MLSMAKLFMVATPIGNLEDVSLRALRVLREVASIFCEDTRKTRKLLQRYEITTVCFSLHEHSGVGSYQKVLDLLNSGRDVAYVTDAGTPGLSDPGGKLVARVLDSGSGHEIIPIPGASALLAALSIAGVSVDKFVFMGFPPVKNKREKYFKEICSFDYPVVFYESTYRLEKSLAQLACVDPFLNVIVCGELTKKFEKVYRGRIVDVVDVLRKVNTKGEFVVIVYRKYGTK